MNDIKRKYRSNEVVVNNKSNFKCHLVRCQTIMDNNDYNELVIKGMGKATSKAINLALQLNLNNFETFDIKPRTYSVDILEDRNCYKKPIQGADRDGFDPDELDPAMTKKMIHIPAIEIKLSKSKFESDRIRNAKKQFKDRKKSDKER